MRLGPPPEEPEVPGQFWIDFIRDTSPVFRKPTIEQLGEFIAPTWQALIDGSKYVDAAAARDHRRARPGRHRRGQRRRRFRPSRARGRPWVRIVSCNPAEMKDPAIAPFSSGYPVGRSKRAGRASSRRSSGPIATCGPTSRPSPGQRRRRAVLGSTRPGFHLGVTVAEPVPVPGRGRLPARACRSDRPGTGSTRRCGRPRRPGSCPSTCGRGTASLIYLSLGSLGSADVGLMQRLVDLLATTRASRHRLEGPAGRPDHAPRQPDRRGVPAPAGDPAAGRPRHHPRRQQHGHRVVPPRQADDRAAAVLGPGRQRPAHR